MSATPRIRRATIHDLPGTYRVCLRTGDAGRDATASNRDPDLLGHVYVGPYVVGEPGLARVVTDETGVAGYLLAAADTRRFEAWAEREWWPPLRERYPLRPPSDLPDPQAWLVEAIHAPGLAPDAVVGPYPAHLHIDLLEPVRGLGLGRVLIEGLLADLRERGVAGVHLDVAKGNENGIGFYRHLGFEVVAPRPDSLLMGLRL